MVVHARFIRAEAVLAQHIGGHRKDGEGAPARLAPDASGGLVAVHDGHLHIHEDGVVVRESERIERLLAIVRLVDHKALRGEQLAGDLAVDGVVFDKEQAGAAERGEIERGLRTVAATLHGVVVHGPPEDLHHDIKEVGRVDRLAQDAVHTALVGGLRSARGSGGEQDNLGHHGEVGKALDDASRGQPIHARHALVDEQELDGRLGCQVVQPHDGLFGARGRGYLKGEGREVGCKETEDTGVVVDDEDAEAPHVERDFVTLPALVFVESKHDIEAEGAAHAREAIDGDLSLHPLDQLLADGEAEACAAVAAGGGAVGLGEGLEKATNLLRRHADAGVSDAEAKPDAGLRRFLDLHGDDDVAPFRELHRVGDQVGEDLAEAERIADEPVGYLGTAHEDEFEAALFGRHREDGGEVVEQPVEFEGDRLKFELSCLDFGQVEDVVEDVEERLGSALRLGEIVGLARCEFGAERELDEADDGIHRRPDLVAHVGEEITLAPRSRLCGLLGPFEPRGDAGIADGRGDLRREEREGLGILGGEDGGLARLRDEHGGEFVPRDERHGELAVGVGQARQVDLDAAGGGACAAGGHGRHVATRCLHIADSDGAPVGGCHAGETDANGNLGTKLRRCRPAGSYDLQNAALGVRQQDVGVLQAEEGLDAGEQRRQEHLK